MGSRKARSQEQNYRFMYTQCHPAIPLATTDLSCGSSVKDLTCRRYAADEMMTQHVLGNDPVTPYGLHAYGRRCAVAWIASAPSSHLGALRLGGRR
jgi:hypothetical protein